MRLPPFLMAKESSMDQADASGLKRRSFLRQVCSSTLMATVGAGIAACRSTGANWSEPVTVSFVHGVASGDPLIDRIILWTRVTPHNPDEDREIIVHWQIASDTGMQNIVTAGDSVTGPDHDYTVKVDAAGLQPGQVYFYRFSAGTAHSPVGRIKTLPSTDVAKIKLAVFSCSNYPAGYFNVYADAAKQNDIDVALHIGDYIYEYESTGYGCDKAKELGRISDPENLLLVLNDYRRRYAQYRTDPDLQAVHAHLPFIAVWDDHEFADDAWRDGSVDHKPTMEGPFSLRKAAAIRAYHEWMPIRLPDPHNPEKIYRSFDFGKLVSLHMLDTRMIGRDQQVIMSSYYDENDEFDENKYRADLASPHRHMMGEEQISWLEHSVKNSKAAWQIIGQQVLMARMDYPLPIAMGDISCADYAKLKEQAQRGQISLTSDQQSCLAAPMLPCYLDSWDGYQNDREKLFGIMQRHNKNMVVLAGDTHNAWASDLRDNMKRQIGVEFAGSSVSSPGMECSHPGEDPEKVAHMMKQIIEPLYYAETSKRGYMIITATENEVRCDWRFVDTVHSQHYTAAVERSLRTVAGAGNRRIIELA